MDSSAPKQVELPSSRAVQTIVGSLSPTLQLIFYVFVFLFASSALAMLYHVSQSFTVTVPAEGGHLREGVVGLPQFINPILAVTGPGQDLTELVYSGLMKKTPEGQFVADLAESYSVSEDEKSYTFIIRKDAVFQDGTPLTADDVVFTVGKAQEPNIKSPKRVSWDGVTVTKVDERTVRFDVKQPYPFFLENATLGILPKHIWNDVTDDEFTFSNFNKNPIGSGPYKVDNVRTNSGGVPLSYELESFSRYVDGKPLITNLSINFYSSEQKMLDAYNAGAIDTFDSLSADQAAALSAAGAHITEATLPRIFGVFFNQTKASVFANKEVKQALYLATNKEAIVTNVLHGYATPIDAPLSPADMTTLAKVTNRSYPALDSRPLALRIGMATSTLEKAGWKLGSDGIYAKKPAKGAAVRLAFTLSTSDAPELTAIANELKQEWKVVGADVTVNVYETGDLNQNVIRPRNYDALLFGEIVSRDIDLFAYWHSSQRNDPGLNIAEYTNSKVDKLLDQARSTPDDTTRFNLYPQVLSEIHSDMPAIFLYSPDFLYETPANLKGVTFTNITDAKDRFLGIEHWYLETDTVWKIFTRN